MTRYIVATVLLLALAACGSSGSNNRAGKIGTDTDDYKKSPCACGPVIAVPNLRS